MGSTRKQSEPRCLGQRVRAGFRGQGTKAMYAHTTRDIQSPVRPIESRLKNRSVSPALSPDFRGAGRSFVQFHFHSPAVDSPFYGGVRRPSMMARKVVRIEDRMDRWRFTCPNGHRSWEPTNHHFWCQQCARQEGIDGVFHELRDRKNGECYARDEVRLVTPLGPYDRDLDGRGRA